MPALRLLVRAVACLALLVCATTAQAAERTVILVMFDGFSPAMADATETPNLNRIKKEGVWSRHLVPVYPTMSMPNHTSFVTGCWPEKHGIVQNSFIDPERGRLEWTDDADWMTGCESVWQAAERQGVHAAAFNFWNRWSQTKGALATYANKPQPWEELPTDEEILARAIKLLNSSDTKHPRLIAIYFRGPDHEAHVHGVTSPEALAEVRKADDLVGQLMKAIALLPKEREASLVIGTDHGMMPVRPLINLGRIMNRHWIMGRDAGDGGSAYLYLDEDESIERVEKVLAQYAKAFSVYRTGKYPPYAHLGSSKRLGDLMIVAKPPYYVAPSASLPWYAHAMGMTWFWSDIFTPDEGQGLNASHGYDPAIEAMHGIFYAWGAGVAKGKQVEKLDMVDVHPTVMSLLGLEPGKPVDGKAVTDVFVEP